MHGAPLVTLCFLEPQKLDRSPRKHDHWLKSLQCAYAASLQDVVLCVKCWCLWRSCKNGIRGPAMGMVGKAWSSGALCVVQNAETLPQMLHPRTKLECECCLRA